MAQQDEPLYDFPEPSQASQRKLLAHQRGRGSLRSISVLDRLLLTVPVWLQLSINPATALHILRREPPGTFLVRKSRTSQRNVLCLRLADNSVPSFVQQFGIREEHSTLSLETSAISFPDLPRLISFYCVSRDVLPFPLELPEAIARATSHKELESISHMGVEFWNSHLNVRGPREAVKPQTDNDKKTDAATPAPHTTHPLAAAVPHSAPPQPNSAAKNPGSAAASTFDEFCPIRTRSPRELNFGSGRGALCFINPLFLQSMTAFTRRRMFKRSLKVRVSTETSSLLSPPLISPPPPPLMPKAKGRCRALKKSPLGQSEARGLRGEENGGAETLQLQGEEAAPCLPARLGTVMEDTPDDGDYMQPPPPAISLSRSPAVPSVSPAAPPPLLPKACPGLGPHTSPATSPAHSPYQSPSISPKLPLLSLSPHHSPNASPPSLSPYQSPSPSPKVPFSLSPFTSPSLSQLAEEVYSTPTATLGRAEEEEEVEDEEEEADDDHEQLYKEMDARLALQMNACVLDTDSCSSFSSLEEAAESPPRLPQPQDAQPQNS